MSFIPVSELAKEIKGIDDELFFLDEEEDQNYIETLQSKLYELQYTMQNKIKFCLRLYAYHIAVLDNKMQAFTRIDSAVKARVNKIQSLRDFIFESKLHSRLEKIDGDFCTAIGNEIDIKKQYQFSADDVEVGQALDQLAEVKFNLSVARDIEVQAVEHRKSIQAQEDNIKKYILEYMQKHGMKKVDGGMLSALYNDGRESIAVLDDSFLPDDCIKTEIVKTPIKAEIKKHLDAGETIRGVEVVKAPFVTIR